jgi:hypothetical protein
MHAVRDTRTPGTDEGPVDFPHGDLARLRRLVGRRMLWLQRSWRPDPLDDPLAGDARAERLLGGRDRSAELAFYRDDPEAAALTQELREQSARLAQRDARQLAAGTATTMQRLGGLFGLSAFELDVLLLALAAELDPAFEDLYAYLQGDADRRDPSLELALDLLTEDEAAWAEARQRLAGEPHLLRFAMITAEPGGGGPSFLRTGFRLDERICDYLLGVDRIDRRVAAWVRDIPNEPLAEPAHRDELDAAERLIREAVAGSPEWLPVCNLVGPPAAARAGVARALCDRLGVRLLEIDLPSLPAGTERERALRLLEREALLQPAAYYLEPPPAGPGEPAVDLGPIADGLGTLLFVAGERPAATASIRSPRAVLGVELALPDPARRRELWRSLLEGTPAGEGDALDRLAQQFRLGPVEMRRAAATAALRAGGGVTPSDLWRACREQAAAGLHDLAVRLEPSFGWEDLVLPADAAQALRDIAAQVAHQAQVYERWGFGAKLTRGRGISALFSGPSGTGKTMAAEVLAAELSLDLYRIDLSGVVSKYIGETEKNLRRVFDAAEAGGAILFFDEADALFGKRSEVRDSHDRYANIEINYLLQRMEDYRGVAVLATNMRSALDPGFLRRLRFVVEFPFPDAVLRERIWRAVLPAQAELAPLDHELLSSWEIAGGNIRNIAVNAAFQAAAEGAPIGMWHLVRAARREYVKIGKLIREGELGPGHEGAGP